MAGWLGGWVGCAWSGVPQAKSHARHVGDMVLCPFCAGRWVEAHLLVHGRRRPALRPEGLGEIHGAGGGGGGELHPQYLARALHHARRLEQSLVSYDRPKMWQDVAYCDPNPGVRVPFFGLPWGRLKPRGVPCGGINHPWV